MGAIAALAPATAHAEDPMPAPMAAPAAASFHPGVGGHIGIATSLVTLQNGDAGTQTIGDQFSLAFPVGIGFKISEKAAIDFETIAAIPVHPRAGFTGFTVDPGIVYDLGSAVIGLRIKWDIGGPSNIGLIPLIHKAIADVGHGANWFVEAAFPTTLAFTSDAAGADQTNFSFNVVFHTGIGF